ncbi:MAG: hypothetical protein ACOC1O_01860, partial [bacterium]
MSALYTLKKDVFMVAINSNNFSDNETYILKKGEQLKRVSDKKSVLGSCLFLSENGDKCYLSLKDVQRN